MFGPNVTVPFTVNDLADPKIKRGYKSPAEMASEHSNMRVWGGIHFRNSLEVGKDMGKIAADLGENFTQAKPSDCAPRTPNSERACDSPRATENASPMA